MLLAMMLIAAEPTVMLKTAVAIPAEPRAAAPRSRYRLDPDGDVPFDNKAAATRTTGGQCAITGPTLCTRRPRTLLAAPLR